MAQSENPPLSWRSVGFYSIDQIAEGLLGTLNPVPHLPKANESQQRFSITSAFSDLIHTARNESFRWLVGSFVIILVAAGISGSLQLHIKTFFWQLTPSQLPVLLGVSLLATIVGFMLSPRLCALLDKKGALILGASVWGVVQVGLTSSALLGLLPDSNDLVFAALIVGGILQGLSGAQVPVVSASMLADLVDEHELHTGTRQEGIFFGAFAFSNKFAQGAGVIVGGLVLDLVDWPTSSDIRVAADIGADTLATLAFAYGPIVGLLVVPAVLFAMKYRMTRESHVQIRESLKRKWEAAEPASSGAAVADAEMVSG